MRFPLYCSDCEEEKGVSKLKKCASFSVRFVDWLPRGSSQKRAARRGACIVMCCYNSEKLFFFNRNGLDKYIFFRKARCRFLVYALLNRCISDRFHNIYTCNHFSENRVIRLRI